MAQSTTIDEYIQTFPTKVQAILQKMRKAIHTVAPQATETISYSMPAFKLNGRILVYFAGWTHHVSVYPVPKGGEAFNKELSQYQTGKGTVRFPLDKPIPYDFIKELTKLRIEENAPSE